MKRPESEGSVWLSGILILLCVVGLTAWRIGDDYFLTLAANQRLLSVTSRSLEAQVERKLGGLVARLQDIGTSLTPADGGGRVQSAWSRERMGDVLGLDSVLVGDAAGQVVGGGREDMAGLSGVMPDCSTLSGKSFFFGAPEALAAHEGPIFPLLAAWPLFGSDGRCRGSVAFVLSREFLGPVLRQSVRDSGGVALLLTGDGMVLAGEPDPSTHYRRRFADVRAGVSTSGPEGGRAHFSVGGEERGWFAVLRKVGQGAGDGGGRGAEAGALAEAGLVVMVGDEVSVLLGPWRQRSVLYFGVAVLVAIGTLMLVRRARVQWTLARRHRHHLLEVMDSAQDYMVMLGGEGQVIVHNRAFREAMDFPPGTDLDGLTVDAFLTPESKAYLLETALPAAARDGQWAGETEFRTAVGTIVPVWLVVAALRHPEGIQATGLPSRFSAVARDIRRRREAEAQLRLAASVYENTSEGVIVTDTKAVILSVNPAFSEITGYSANEALGQTPRLLKSDHHDQAFYRVLWAQLLQRGRWQGEIWNRRKGGEAYLEWLSISAVHDAGGKPIRYVSVFRDITELRRKDERIRHLAYHDALTGLPNRVLLMDRLEQALRRARRERSLVGVLFLDLDRFKVINDSLGHDIGDHLLTEVGERLVDTVRRSDTVARMGGDEFVVLLDNPVSTEEVAGVAERLLESVGLPFDIRGHTLQITPSIGISLFPQDADEAADMLKNADTAMYEAKGMGRNAFCFFDVGMNQRVLDRMRLEADLREALETGGLSIAYQPKVLLADGQCFGLEALVRWEHPVRGSLSPAMFIPVAEDSGLIVPLGEWVLETACRQWRSWKDQGITPPGMAVNLSGRQFRDEKLIERIRAIVTETGIDPRALELELTESSVMEDPIAATRVMLELREMGIEVAVDDFGTGYSSLSHLRRLPIGVLKVDRSFVSDIGLDADGEAVVNSVISLGNALRLTVVAEGVETEDQAQFLRSHGCEFAQGFLYAPPMTADAVLRWLLSGSSDLPPDVGVLP